MHNKRKSAFLSLLTIGGVIAFVAGTVSLATFQDERDATIAVTAGTVVLALDGEDTEATVALEFSAGNCNVLSASNMAPGSTCDFDVEITNEGSLGFSLAVDVSNNFNYLGDDYTAGGGGDCFTAGWFGGAPNTAYYAPSGGSDTAVVRISLANQNECQAADGAFTIGFTATYVAAP